MSKKVNLYDMTPIFFGERFVVDRYNYVPPVVEFRLSQETQTIPDQSLSIDEVVRRFSKGIPVDVDMKEPVYIEQYEFDLEGMARLDFGEKLAMADEFRVRSERAADEFERMTTTTEEEEEDLPKTKKAASKKAAKDSGIGSLDNTMPDDTKQ